MASPRVVEDLEVLEQLGAAVREVQAASWTSSTFSVAKKLSATALSQQLPRRLILQTISCCSRTRW
jgi:hypothetical protein